MKNNVMTITSRPRERCRGIVLLNPSFLILCTQEAVELTPAGLGLGLTRYYTSVLARYAEAAFIAHLSVPEAGRKRFDAVQNVRCESCAGKHIAQSVGGGFLDAGSKQAIFPSCRSRPSEPKRSPFSC
jgi:hypothetical protein